MLAKPNPLAASIPPPPSRSPRLVSGIHGSGAMADLIRAHPWSRTPLGRVETWPETLLTTVNTVLGCQFPALVFWGPQFILLYNDAMIPLQAEKHPRYLGHSAQECWQEAWHLIGPQLEAVLHRGDPSFHENVLVPVIREGQLTDVYWTYSYSPIHEPSGKIGGILVVCHDVTEERRTAALARDSAARLDAIYNTSLEYIGLLSTDGIVLDCNSASLRFAGNTREDLVGKPFWDCPWWTYTPGASDAVREAIARAAAGEHIRYEAPLKRPDGEVIVFDFSLSPVRDSSGKIVFLVPEAHDITHVKRTEAALKDSEKLAAVGRLAASIAHEVNNPLESVTNLLYLSQTTENLEEIREYLRLADRELRRVSVISTQTLRFYRQTTGPRPVQSSELFDSVLSIHQGRIVNARIQVQRRLRATQPVECFEGEMRQVLMNLIGNAVDAMRDGGRLFVRSREGTHMPSGRKGLCLTVADTGHGVAPQTMKRIFEPFFTTKGMSGTGLGLWVTQGIVDRHHGVLSVRSSQRPSRSGTVFRLFLPFDGVAPSSAS